MVSKRYWNPYLVGGLLGVLSWVAFGVANNPIGMTTALSEASGALACPLFGCEVVAQNSYWQKHVPAWDYGTLFLLGTFAGAVLASVFSKTFSLELVPAVWRERFGGSVGRRLGAAFVGGFIIMYGARLAGGCTSGHGISGSLQLAVSSWVFFIVMFLSGVLTARVLFGRNTRK